MSPSAVWETGKRVRNRALLETEKQHAGHGSRIPELKVYLEHFLLWDDGKLLNLRLSCLALKWD